VAALQRNSILVSVALCLFAALTLPGCGDDSTPTAPPGRSLSEDIDEIALQYVKVGGMIGVIDKHQRRHIFSYGSKSVADSTPPDANTVFEIGSITKTFTATIAADMFLNGLIPDDTLSHILPSGQVTLPTKDGVEIRVLHLATHSSGLPRTPHNSSYPRPPGYDPEDPYAAYSTQHVYDYLTNHCVLEFTPGTWWLYSNTGFGVLGHVAGLIDGTSYETVLTRDVFEVLGMDNSSLELTAAQTQNLALGHDSNQQIVPNWTAQDIFQGAGFIKSSLNDMFLYLEANLGLVDTPLKDAIDLTHQPQFRQGSLGDIGLAWYIQQLDDGQTIVYHGGGTAGYDTYLGFNKAGSTGAIVLFNARIDESVLVVGEQVLKAINQH
jgi:CubicO group peptidase (beta-lactamase class C family)